MRQAILGVCVLLACGDSGGGTAAESTSAGEATSVSTTGALPTSGESSASSSSGGETSGGSTTGEASTTSEETTTGGAVVDIVEALDGIEGLTWEEQESDIPGYRFFLLYYLQPADHNDPDGLKFTQHMMLYHRDPEAPMVIGTDGYFIYPWYQALSEPASLLHANQLTVEHRFFANSRPEPADWGLLTIEQAAADHHRITTALKDAIYHAAWVSTGASKGGMTASYFRRFYPDDVDATVAYVAPLSFAVEDPRYWVYLDAIDPTCEAKLTEFRRELLLRRNEMLMRVAEDAAQNGYTYEFIDAEHALEVTALNASWAFWQYGGDACAEVPTQAATDSELWDFLEGISPVSDIRDERMIAFEPYYFQASVQLGAPRTDDAALADLLVYPGFDVAPSYVMPGPTKDTTYDPAAMQGVKEWMATEATRMLFVYGEKDPWTGGAYEADAMHDVHKFMAPGANHGAKIGSLTAADRAAAYALLEQWTGVTPVVRPLPQEMGLKELLGALP